MEEELTTLSERFEKAASNTLINDLTTGSVSQKLIKFAIPFMLANLMQVLYNIVDMVVVGQFVDSAGISAVANGGDIINLVTIFCIGLSTAGQIVIAQLVGNKDTDGIKKAIGTLYSFMGLAAIAFTALSLLLVDWLILAVNVPPEAQAGARAYCVVLFSGMVFIFGFNAVSAILRGMGDSKRPLIIITIASVLNLILDLVLIKPMGIKGVAIATVTAQGLSFILSMIYLYIRRDAFGFDYKLKSFRIDGGMLRFLLRLGLPLGLLYSSVTISKVFVNSWVNSYGVVLSAVTGIGTKIGQVASIITSALGTAGSTMIAQSVGAGKLSRVNRIIYVSWGWGLLYTAVLSILFVLFPDQIFGLFSKDPEVLTQAADYVIIAILNFNAFALRIPMIALLEGTGNGKLAIIIGIVDGVVARIGLSLFMGLTLNMGIRGFWFGNVIASFMPFVIGCFYYFTGAWKKHISTEGSTD